MRIGYPDSLQAVICRLVVPDFENALLNAELDRIADGRTRWQWATIALCVGCLLLCYAIFWIYKRNCKLRQQREAMDAQIEKHEEQVANQAAEFLEEKCRRQRKMAQLTLRLNTLSEAMNRLRGIVLDKEADDTRKVEESVAVFREMSAVEDASEVVRLFFEEANETFFSNLYTWHPNLTKSEVRLCSYLMMNMSNKEIAAITHRSVRTIETAKYRLSNKFGLADIPLDVYLRRFFDKRESE